MLYSCLDISAQREGLYKIIAKQLPLKLSYGRICPTPPLKLSSAEHYVYNKATSQTVERVKRPL